GVWGQFIYGVLNRLLIVTGLHNLLNSVMWFIVGNYHGYTGDMNRFFHGDPTAGAFMTGFFPVMMFGLPGACLAMYHTALPERRNEVKGLLASIALTAFLTGVTEPVEFSFMFLAPALYAVHALLTGFAFIITDALHMRLGFTFSAGLFDYLLNFNKDSHALLLLPVGAVYFALYYGIFRFAIVRFDLKTPGREDPGNAAVNPAMAGVLGAAVPAAAASPVGGAALAYITALGGAGNLESVDACLTRLRLIVRSQDAIDVPTLKRLGARGVVRLSASALQVVVGQTAERIAGDIREALKHLPQQPKEQEQPRSRPEAPVLTAPLLERLLAALGGAANVRSVEPASSRLRIGVKSATGIDGAAIRALGLRGMAVAGPGCVHVIVGPAAAAAGASLRELLAS
ncbi:MAG: PTS transporter subunit EIIC, partial [Steroidobacteraceae bacterium]